VLPRCIAKDCDMPLSREIQEPFLSAVELKATVNAKETSRLHKHYYSIESIDFILLQGVEQLPDSPDKTWFIEDIIEFMRNNQDKVPLDFLNKTAILLHLFLRTVRYTTDLEEKKFTLTVTWLLHKGANLAAMDSQGNTPLHIVVKRVLSWDVVDLFSSWSKLWQVQNAEESPALWQVHNHAGETPEKIVLAKFPELASKIAVYSDPEQFSTEEDKIDKLYNQVLKVFNIATEQEEKIGKLEQELQKTQQESQQYQQQTDKKIQNLETWVKKFSTLAESSNTPTAEPFSSLVMFSPLPGNKNETNTDKDKDKEKDKSKSTFKKKFATVRK
jgi:hypothetical protein